MNILLDTDDKNEMKRFQQLSKLGEFIHSDSTPDNSKIVFNFDKYNNLTSITYGEQMFKKHKKQPVGLDRKMAIGTIKLNMDLDYDLFIVIVERNGNSTRQHFIKYDQIAVSKLLDYYSGKSKIIIIGVNLGDDYYYPSIKKILEMNCYF